MSSHALEKFPRVRLAQLPTPFTQITAPELGLKLYLKRDDLTGNGLSGNKARKLEFLIADARAQNCATLVTCGAVQSNCARALAVAAAQTHLESYLILTGAVPAEDDGNLLISRLAGAEIEFLTSTDPAERDALLARRTADLAASGRRPYVVPFGGSSEVGALGYVQAAFEMATQLGPDAARFRHIVTPMASGGTYAGLYLGFALAGLPIRPIGAFVCGSATEWVPTLLDLIHGLARLLGVVVAADESDIRLIDARGAGYDQPTPAELDFIARFVRATGVLLDPVYSGKALYALWRYLECGALDDPADVIFLHTGGSFGIFPHRRGLSAALAGLEPHAADVGAAGCLPDAPVAAQAERPATVALHAATAKAASAVHRASRRATPHRSPELRPAQTISIASP
ncbi:MAG TPA: D-cysteine desulfhydrase family protein [Phycisphaerae bacterium]|nr:D-cysteine desulfhydrase family protein [Phycisphaerales bacterium]HRX86840.1 D-cysteine desulfhydrase family protein [Phycisphaerae bacterium]